MSKQNFGWAGESRSESENCACGMNDHGYHFVQTICGYERSRYLFNNDTEKRGR
ncbi:MAG TPA: hypothetical protein ACFYEF_00170 [Candidatus Wunengus sp. YC63]|uniref:hypothetical protein n=1 Tax=Candidatus Wunengus sp. YC63 TaxID=3367699 RepID=UPI004026F038